MKIDLSAIFIDHLRTLYNAKSNKTSYGDIILFYGVPIFAGCILFAVGFKLKVEAYNLSITFFGIFIALLLNIQVAIFSIFQRKPDRKSDSRELARQNELLNSRRSLLLELNSNISYLTAFSSISLLVFLLFFVVEKTEGFFSAISAVLYMHFVLTFMMIIKRAHLLFQKEYINK